MHLMIGRVLLVEDDDATRRLMEDSLTEAGFDVVSASHGGEALRMLNREVPDLIVLDLMLPWINGIEVLATVRQQPQLASVPVLVATGTVMSAFDLRGYAPVSVLHKPIDVDTLVGTVNGLISRPKDL